MTQATSGQLASYIERLERLAEEKAELGELTRSVFAGVKSAGFDVKAVKALLKERRQDKAELAELNALIDLYRAAIGGLADTPLGRAGEPK